MATISERLAYVLTFDTSSGVKSLEKMGSTADKQLGKVDKRLDRLGVGMQKFGAGAVAAAGIAGVGLFKMAQGAADADANMSALEQVVGDVVAQDIGKWAEDSARGVGLASKDAVAASTTFAQLGKIIGFGSDELGDFSTDLVTLAADFAAFKNVSPDQALEDISAAFAGSTEVMRKYGIFLDDATLKSAYFRETGEKVTGTLTAQQKIVAINAELYRQGADMIGQWGRESGELSGQQAILKAELTNLSDEIGAGILPHLVSLFGIVNSAVSAFGSLDSATNGMVGTFATFGVAALALAGSVSFVTGKLIMMRSNLLALKPALVALKATMVGHPILLLATVAAGVGAAFLLLRDRTDDVAEAVDDMAQAMTDAKDAAEGLSGWISDTVGEQDVLIRTLDAAGTTIDEVADAALEGGDAWSDMALRIAKASRDIGTTSDDDQAAVRGFLEEIRLGTPDAVAKYEALARVHGEVTEATEGTTEATEDSTDATEANVAAVEKIIDAQNEAREAVAALHDATLESIDSSLGYRNQVARMTDAIAKANEAVGQGENAQKDYEQAQRDAEGAALSQAAAAVRQAEDIAAASGETLTAKQRTGIYIDELEVLAGELNGPAAFALAMHIERLQNIPSSISTNVTTNFRTNSSGTKIGSGADARFNYASAEGGIFTRPTVSLIGENGPEAVVPLKKGNTAPGASPLPMGGGVTIINNYPAGVRPDDVENAQRRYRNIQGTL